MSPRMQNAHPARKNNFGRTTTSREIDKREAAAEVEAERGWDQKTSAEIIEDIRAAKRRAEELYYCAHQSFSQQRIPGGWIQTCDDCGEITRVEVHPDED